MKEYSPYDIVRSGLCIGCGICVACSETSGASMKFDKFGELKPFGSSGWYKQASLNFSKTCPFSPSAENEDRLSEKLFSSHAPRHISIGVYEKNWVGHVEEDQFRLNGSSGGMVSWVAVQLIRKNLIDGLAHVVAVENPEKEGRFFKYRISRSEKEILEGAHSRYYPVELSEILKTIREVPGRYAVVAVPCMIKAVQLLRQNDLVFSERICYTLGLFCGHMKSARFAESFAWQMNVPFNDVEKVEYRNKFPDRPANWYNAMLTTKNGNTVNKDWWHLKDGDWGAGFFMNNACNFCDDVVAETADISFGDAWTEPYSSDGKGTNVVVVRTILMNKIVNTGINEEKLKLEEVDAGFVEKTQAAGLRQRREGLVYRLGWAWKEIKPVKRIPPGKNHLTKSRKLIYYLRYQISKWSHRMFWIARKIRKPGLYLFWARAVASIYYGVAYHKGNRKEIMKRWQDFGASPQ